MLELKQILFGNTKVKIALTCQSEFRIFVLSSMPLVVVAGLCGCFITTKYPTATALFSIYTINKT